MELNAYLKKMTYFDEPNYDLFKTKFTDELTKQKSKLWATFFLDRSAFSALIFHINYRFIRCWIYFIAKVIIEQ